MKKAIVTGATGFIGKFLVRELVKQNVEVIAVVRRGTKNLNTMRFKDGSSMHMLISVQT